MPEDTLDTGINKPGTNQKVIKKPVQKSKTDVKESLGLVQVYTGTGKGKTTAALGLSLRAIGKGLKVHMIQFMKGDIEYGEITAAKKIDGLVIEQFGRPDFVTRESTAKVDIEFAQKALERARELLRNNECDILILDEINVALDYNLIAVDDVISLIQNKPKNIELILTGRYANSRIIEMADLVTDMQEVKHPYQTGIPARDGIEH